MPFSPAVARLVPFEQPLWAGLSYGIKQQLLGNQVFPLAVEQSSTQP